MLSAARVKPGEMVYDLGSGDGRIIITAAQKFQARAVGVELRGTSANPRKRGSKRWAWRTASG
jgi:cyclopropane fatty-acyl-phospholipid synthase-like methyltransferase